MPRLRRYECPSCTATFEVMHQTSADPPPRFCPQCGFDTLTEPLAAPHIAGSIVKVVDSNYRQMEEGAEHRARVAQEVYGASSEEAAGLKITDLRDNARAGESANVPVVNDVSRMMAALPPGATGFNGAQGVQYSAAVQSGPFPNAGARTQQRVRAMHSADGHATVDRPALETQMPGYRPRV